MLQRQEAEAPAKAEEDRIRKELRSKVVKKENVFKEAVGKYTSEEAVGKYTLEEAAVNYTPEEANALTEPFGYLNQFGDMPFGPRETGFP